MHKLYILLKLLLVASRSKDSTSPLHVQDYVQPLEGPEPLYQTQGNKSGKEN